MMKSYPNYKRFELEKRFEKLPRDEKALIKDFLMYCRISAGDRKLQDIQRNLIQFQHIIGKSLKETTLQDLRFFLSLLNSSDRTNYTKNGIKVHVRKFLMYHFKDWSVRFEEFKDIKLQKGFNEKKINDHTLLKKEQIELIMKKEKDLDRKALFITHYEGGVRPCEISNLTWDNIKLNADGDISEIYIYATKTEKARTIFVKEATFYLKKLYEIAKSKYVFPSKHNINQPLPTGTIHRYISEMGQNVGIKLYPYLMRHSRATELYKNMPSKVAQKFMGHSKDMSDVYAHISSNDVKESMLKTIYNIEEMPPEKRTELEKKVEVLTKAMIEIVGAINNIPQIKKADAKKITSALEVFEVLK